jgi:hypothetical protein
MMWRERIFEYDTISVVYKYRRLFKLSRVVYVIDRSRLLRHFIYELKPLTPQSAD